MKPLPVADPQRVVRLERWFESRNLGDLQYAFSYPEYLYLRGHATGFAGLAAAGWPLRAFAEWRGGAMADKLQGQLVSANYFAAMGVAARFGRTFASRRGSRARRQSRDRPELRRRGSGASTAMPAWSARPSS